MSNTLIKLAQKIGDSTIHVLKNGATAVTILSTSRHGQEFEKLVAYATKNTTWIHENFKD